MITNMFCTFCISCKQSATSKLTTADFSCHCQVKVFEKASGEKVRAKASGEKAIVKVSGEKVTLEASGNFKLAVIGKMKLECAYLQVM